MTQLKLIHRQTGKEYHANQFEVNIGAESSTIQCKVPDLKYSVGMKPVDFHIPAFTGLFDRVTDRPVFVGDIFAGPDDTLYEIKGYHKERQDDEATELKVYRYEDQIKEPALTLSVLALAPAYFKVGNNFEPVEQLKRKIPKFREMRERIEEMKRQLMQPVVEEAPVDAN